MKQLLLIISFVMLGLAASVVYAKPGIIVKGENGTKWCCPDGKKGDGCEKGAASTPVGKYCNFASKFALPNTAMQPPAFDISNAPIPMAASPTFDAKKIDTTNKIFEEKIETIWIDSNTGSPVDNPNAGTAESRGIFNRCGPWQTVSQTANCQFATFCVFNNQKKTVTTKVQQRQCRNGIQQRTITNSSCGC